jgi:ATP-dependent DNA helicase RecQ
MDRVLATLRETFGFDGFREGQRAVCDALLAGRSALAVFPTGGGKSLCYQLPALLLEGTTLVVSPLIALMKDQVDFLRARGVAAARLDSSLDAAASAGVLEGLSSGSLRLLYVAPERFLNERFLERLGRARVPLLAIDEAHCISQWGHNFRPDYLKLAEHARRLGFQRVLALTATATPAVADDVAAAFGIAPADRVVTGFYRPNLELDLRATAPADRDAALLSLPFDGPSIVYVTLQATAERVAERLAARGVAAAAYHAGMEAEERAAIQDRFMAGQVRVVVATIAFGMGIDKADVRAVVHYNLPKSIENYAQEIGRAGRDGQRSVCTMLACRDDLGTLANFAHGDAPTRRSVEGVVRALLGEGDEVQVSIRSLSDAHDMRELVVKTLITWLELDGWLRQTTPVYTEYKWRWLRAQREVLATFDPARRAFLEAVFARANHGRTWDKLDLGEAARALGEPRDRLIRALDFLAEKGHLELQAAGVQQRLVVVRRPDELEVLVDRVAERFAALEASEVRRLEDVVAFVEGEGCHTARLVRGAARAPVRALHRVLRRAADAPAGDRGAAVARARRGRRGPAQAPRGAGRAEVDGAVLVRDPLAGDHQGPAGARSAVRGARRGPVRRGPRPPVRLSPATAASSGRDRGGAARTRRARAGASRRPRGDGRARR